MIADYLRYLLKGADGGGKAAALIAGRMSGIA